MKPRLAERHQRVAALLLLALILALAGQLLLRPFAAAYRERNALIEALHKQALHYRAAAQDRSLFIEQLEQLQHDPVIASYHLRSTSPALAAAELQQHIQKTVESHGGRLVSMQVVPSAPQPGLTIVTVRIRLRTDIGGLQHVLFSLESGRPLITLDNVLLHVVGAARGAGADATESLDLGFDASGYLLERPT